MKKLSIYSLIFIIAFALGACDKDETEDISEVTTFPTFQLQGEDPYLINVNDPPQEYTDPGAIVKEGDQTIEYQTNENVNVNQTGFYTVQYQAVNQDGFEGTASRSVIVGCPDQDNKTLTVIGNATNAVAGSYEVTVEKTGYAQWSISDIAGAFNIEINGTIGILCNEVQKGSSAFGMYNSADFAPQDSTLTINWSYPPLGLSGSTVIPVVYE